MGRVQRVWGVWGGVSGRLDLRVVRLGVWCGVVYGAAMVLAFPLVSLFGFAFVMAGALVFGIARAAGRACSLGVGVAMGSAPAWAFMHAWVFNVSEFGYPFLVMYSAMWTGVSAWIGARIAGRFGAMPLGLVGAVACCAAEVARGEVIMGGYPWHLIGHPLVDAAWVAGAGAVVGAYGVSALVCAIAGGVVDVVVGRRRSGLMACGFAAMAWAGLVMVPGPREAGSVRIAVVQTDNPQDNRTPTTPWELVQQMGSISADTRAAARERPELIVWPESMMPGRTMDPASIEVERRERVYWKVRPPSGEPFEMEVSEFASATLALQREVGIPMLVGSEAFDNLRITTPEGGGVEYVGDRVFNSVFLVVDGRVDAKRYDKMFLTPFGEVMPVIRHWPWLQDRVRALGAYGMPFDLSAGKERVVLEVPRGGGEDGGGGVLRVVTPICFEATMPNVCRGLVDGGGERRADVIVNGTNDGWFNWSRAGRAQHLQASRWRCVELGTPMARAANTGVSALVDWRGRIVRRLDTGNGVVCGDLPIMEGRTAYASGGWASAWAIGVLGWWACAWSFVGGGARRRACERGKESVR